jgi:hypothetical protein
MSEEWEDPKEWVPGQKKSKRSPMDMHDYAVEKERRGNPWPFHAIPTDVAKYADKKGLDAVATGGGSDYVYGVIGKNQDGSDRVVLVVAFEDPASPESLKAKADVFVYFTEIWDEYEHVGTFPNTKRAIDKVAQMVAEAEAGGSPALSGVRDWAPRQAPQDPPFAVGDLIELVRMPGEIGPGRPRPGERGKVTWANWVGLPPEPFWQFSVDWEGGSRLMLSMPPDSARKVEGPSMGSRMGMRMVRLQDLLPTEVIDRLIPVMNQIQRRDLDISEGRRRILDILNERKEELLAKEVLPEYLSWFLVSKASEGGDLNRVLMN